MPQCGVALRIRVLVLATLLCFQGLGVRAVSTLGSDEVLVFAVLTSEPTAQMWATNRSLSTVMARVAAIRLEQDSVAAQAAPLGAKDEGRFHRLINAVRFRVPRASVERLAAIPGVARVEPVKQHWPQTSTSVPWIGAASAWSSVATNLDGRGVRVGVIDSGIDYKHANFGGAGTPAAYSADDSTIIEPGSFPTAKVVGGYDFVGDAYDGGSGASPDEDPLDCLGNGHGSHVAGIIAGFGVLTNGVAYSGSYTQGLDFAQFGIGPGVAPRALLYALKVFGCSGSTTYLLDALEWASDPDRDNDLSDRLDVVNMSLGSPFGLNGFPDAENLAINNLADLGCIPVIAAGNSGNTHFIVGSPGATEKGICVANSFDGGATSIGLGVVSPASIAGNYGAVEGAFTKQLTNSGPVQAAVVYVDPAQACGPLVNAGALNGKIALIDRGSCFFVDKIRLVQAAGAIAVVMVNNVPGEPIVMGGSGDTSDIVIPGVMITQANGAIIKAKLAENPVLRLSVDTVIPRPDLADQLNDSSSRGPSAPAGLLKPDISAPGSSIISTKAGSGAAGIAQTGTSMAAPHVAGAAALMRQMRPLWSAAQIKAALMNTATAMRDGSGVAYPESRIGAGQLNVGNAVRTKVTAVSDGKESLVTLNLGLLQLTNRTEFDHFIRLTNHGNASVTLSLSATNTAPGPGVVITPMNSPVTIPAAGSALAQFRFAFEPSLLTPANDATSTNQLNGRPRRFLPETSGGLWFHGGEVPGHVPFYGSVRAAASYGVTATNVGLPLAATNPVITLPQLGASAVTNALVSVFQLGATMSPFGLDVANAGVDLIAVGAASDAPRLAAFADSTVFFGLAVSGVFTTPQRGMAKFEVLVDSNRDGSDDYSIVSGSAGDFRSSSELNTSGSANDVLLVIVRNLSSGAYTTNAYVNAFSDARDGAPYANSVLVLPVSAPLIGLNTGSSRFNYRIRGTGPEQSPSPASKTSTTATFDAQRPLVDTTIGGIANTPFYVDGLPISLTVIRSNATLQGISTVGTASALVLHQHNVFGKRAEVVQLQLGTDDADADGLPDAWELAALGTMAQTGSDDTDGDGASNRDEFVAGTDPLGNTSVLRLRTSIDWSGPLLLQRVSWPAVSNRTYTLLGGTTLGLPLTNILLGPIAAVIPTNQVILTNPPSPLFLRLEVK